MTYAFFVSFAKCFVQIDGNSRLTVTEGTASLYDVFDKIAQMLFKPD